MYFILFTSTSTNDIPIVEKNVNITLVHIIRQQYNDIFCNFAPYLIKKALTIVQFKKNHYLCSEIMIPARKGVTF